MKKNSKRGFVTPFVSVVVIVLVLITSVGYSVYSDQKRMKENEEFFKKTNSSPKIILNTDTQQQERSVQESQNTNASTSKIVTSSVQNNKENSVLVSNISTLNPKGKLVYNLSNSSTSGSKECVENRLISTDDLGTKIQNFDILGGTYYCYHPRAVFNHNAKLIVSDIAGTEDGNKLRSYVIGERLKTFEIAGLLNGTPIISPSGDYIAVGVSTLVKDAGYYPEVYIYKKDGSLFKKLISYNISGLGGNFFPIFWSSDENVLYVNSVTKSDAGSDTQIPKAVAQIFSVDISTGSISKTNIQQFTEGQIIPSPDGKYILYSNTPSIFLKSNDNGSASVQNSIYSIKLIDVNTGKEKVFISDKNGFGQFTWSPDSKKFLYLSVNGLDVGDVDSFTSKTVLTNDKLVNKLIKGLGWVTDSRIVFVSEGLKRINQLFSLDLDGTNMIKIAEADWIQIIGSAFGGKIY